MECMICISYKRVLNLNFKIQIKTILFKVFIRKVLQFYEHISNILPINVQITAPENSNKLTQGGSLNFLKFQKKNLILKVNLLK